MYAAVVFSYGQRPEPRHWPDPTPEPGHSLIQTLAAAINPVDLKMAAGTYFGVPTPPFVAGAEGVGRVLDSAAAAEGTRVWFETGPRGGAFANLTTVEDGHFVEIPDGVEDSLAATLGVAALTAWDALDRRAALRPGETVLVLGASGAVGSVAVQTARLLGARHIVAAARNAAAIGNTVRATADAIVALDDPDVQVLTSRLHAASPAGYDVILDPLWGPPAHAALACAAEGARLVQLGSSANESLLIPSGLLRKTSTSILGSTIYAMPWTVKRELYQRLCQHAVAGRLVVERETLPLTRVGEAWQRQAQSPHRKLVLQP